MSENLTDKLPSKEGAILAAIQKLGDQVGRIDEHLQRLEQRVDTIEQKIDALQQRLDGLEHKVDTRLHDTRPIWHKVVADVAVLQNGQQRLEEGQQALRHELKELNGTVRNFNRDQIVINDVLRRIHLDFHNLDERLYALSVDRKESNS